MIRFLVAGLLAIGLSGCASGQFRDRTAPIDTVAQVDLDRYAGLWYEIARYPNWFEKDCDGVPANYAARPDGKISVRNTCRKGGPDGPAEIANGVATPDASGAKLRVTFTPWLPFIAGDYWILDLDADYRTVVIGNPSGSTGWILAREPQIDAARKAWAEAALTRAGYDPSQLYFTRHSAGASQ